MFEMLSGIFALILFLSPAWLPIMLIWGFKYKFARPSDIAYQKEVKRTREAIRRGRVDGYILRDAMREEEEDDYRR